MEKKLINQIKNVAIKAGQEIVLLALTLFFCAVDKETPHRVKALLLGDLVYFVSPLDAIPDFTPAIGFTDDFAVMTATIAAVATHVKPEHRGQAKALLGQWWQSTTEAE